MVCFERFYEALLAYKEEYGDLFVPSRYIVDGFKLGSKVSYTRRHPERLTEEEFKKLSGIGFIWSVKSRHSFDEIYELLKEYKEDTPVAVVKKATWPDQEIVRGNLTNIAQKVHDAGFTKTAMIVVGDVLDQQSGEQSKLYDPKFAHMYRDAE